MFNRKQREIQLLEYKVIRAEYERRIDKLRTESVVTRQELMIKTLEAEIEELRAQLSAGGGGLGWLGEV